MTDVRNRIDEILGKGMLMSLGTVDDGGVWVADVGYVHDGDLCLYWLSRKDRRHSVALRQNPRVGASITVSVPSEDDLGLQLEGTAEELADMPAVVDAYWKKRAEAPKKPVTNEHAWYKLTPSKIELIDELNFGHEKQVFTP